jgi:hypothetical protein
MVHQEFLKILLQLIYWARYAAGLALSAHSEVRRAQSDTPERAIPQRGTAVDIFSNISVVRCSGLSVRSARRLLVLRPSEDHRLGRPPSASFHLQSGAANLLCFDGPPAAHGTEKSFASGARTSLPWSTQSAATRNASARIATTADSRVRPYANIGPPATRSGQARRATRRLALTGTSSRSSVPSAHPAASSPAYPPSLPPTRSS